MKQVTIIIPIHNDVRFARACLSALGAHTSPNDYRLVVVDDCSDRYTREFLDQTLPSFDDYEVLRINVRSGFASACNCAWTHCGTPYVVLLRCDVLVTPNWLPRLIQCAASDTDIAAVSPLANGEGPNALALPEGSNHLGVDRALSKQAAKCHDAVDGLGCTLFRKDLVGEPLFPTSCAADQRQAAELLGRLTASGRRTVTAAHVYVHRRTREARSHASEWAACDSGLASKPVGGYRRVRSPSSSGVDPLRPLRRSSAHPRRLWPVRYARDAARILRREIRAKGWRSAGSALATTMGRTSTPLYPEISTPLVNRFARRDTLSVTYIFRGLGMTGGVRSVIQLVNELILRGCDARIAAIHTYPGHRDWTWLLSEPMIFKSARHLVHALPPTDIVVATEWCTASWAHQISGNGVARASAYFLQDYEPWFLPESERALRARIVREYGLIPNRIVKSDWLREKLAVHGFPTHKILLGMDLDQFYPRDRISGPPTVLTLARPSTPWRGFSSALQALTEVKKHRPDTRVILFGTDDLKAADFPFDFISAGKVTDQDQLAMLYSQADVFLETSTFQGFGRCALEAMACRTAVVLTTEGGVTEYAVPDVNCLAIPPNAPNEAARAVLRLLDDQHLREGLAANAAETARRFCHRREASETLSYFLSLLGSERKRARLVGDLLHLQTDRPGATCPK